MNDAYNDANTASPTYGIPGKRNGVIVNFSQLNDEQLAAMASNLSLAMGENGLACCQVYFSKPMGETRFPTIYETDFLDAIVRRHHKTTDTLRIGRTNTGHHHLSATREDFLQKLHALCPHLSAPLSLA